jgi:ribosome-associated toxin RatA of RatAB toxin-antitoxin module
MHRTVTASVTAPAARVFAIVSDLGTYPEWLGLVTDAVEAPSDERDVGPAWHVTIRAQIGPFARSKKLRMVRSQCDEEGQRSVARFERRELDGRDHAAWTLEAIVADALGETEVTMELRYDGRLWTAPLEPVLGMFIDDAGPRLEAYASR